MDAQSPKGVLCCVDGGQGVVHTKIPESDLTVTATRDKFTQTATLHMNIGDPLLVFTPNFNHRSARLETLIEDTDRAITETSNEYVTSNLVRGQ